MTRSTSRKAGTRVRLTPVRQVRFEIPLIRKEIEEQGAAYRYALIRSEVMLAPDWLRHKLEIVIHVLVFIFGVVMAWNCGVLAESVAPYKIPTLGISEAFKYVPPALAGVLVAMFSLEHIIALVRGTEVEPAWH